jgi:hypothetical protein
VQTRQNCTVRHDRISVEWIKIQRILAQLINMVNILTAKYVSTREGILIQMVAIFL